MILFSQFFPRVKNMCSNKNSTYVKLPCRNKVIRAENAFNHNEIESSAAVDFCNSSFSYDVVRLQRKSYELFFMNYVVLVRVWSLEFICTVNTFPSFLLHI